MVLELEPPRRMVWFWIAAAESEPSHVEFRLEPIPGGTRLTLTHSREPSAVERARFTGGWTEKLANLRRRLAEEEIATPWGHSLRTPDDFHSEPPQVANPTAT